MGQKANYWLDSDQNMSGFHSKPLGGSSTVMLLVSELVKIQKFPLMVENQTQKVVFCPGNLFHRRLDSWQ